jgi:hypothetical protein
MKPSTMAQAQPNEAIRRMAEHFLAVALKRKGATK